MLVGISNGRTSHGVHDSNLQNIEGRVEEERSRTERLQDKSLERPGPLPRWNIPLGSREEERKGPDGVKEKRLKIEGCRILVFSMK